MSARASAQAAGKLAVLSTAVRPLLLGAPGRWEYAGSDIDTDTGGDSDAGCPGRHFHSGGLRWHLRAGGRGPRLLLLHGTGSSGASWRRLTAALSAAAGGFEILAPDLPGHGRSGPLPAGRSGLDAYAGAVATLVQDLGAWPDIIVGHSAGAAIAARIALEPGADRVAVLSLNGALRPLRGWTALTFVPLARLLGGNRRLPGLVAALVRADPRAVRRLLDSTGSRSDAGMLADYERLMRDPQHIAGTLRMLARWDLRALQPQLHRLGPRLTLVSGAADRTVAPGDADWVHARVPGSGRVNLPALGHLAHEEAPECIARIVVAVARERGLLDDAPLAAPPEMPPAAGIAPEDAAGPVERGA
jgi:magnesium chelatase accessory protein